MGNTELATFIPELWSDEIVAAYKSNLVLANVVTNFNHQGQKGDVIHIPKPLRGSASAKAEATLVTPIVDTALTVDININKHYEYSRHIENISEIQGLSSIRSFYTDDAGYALATQVDTDLWTQTAFLQGGDGAATWNTSVIGSDGSTAYIGTNEAALADAGIREMVQTLDDANIPQRDRVIVIPPVSKNTLLGLARFTEQAFVGEVGMANSIRNGRLGNIYGMDVYVSTQSPTATGAARIGVMMHKSAIALVTQLDIRVQTQYKQEYLADLLTADTVYGVGELRDDAGICFAVVA
jgi:hypothetical protein